jgi:hypothetical protein
MRYQITNSNYCFYLWLDDEKFVKGYKIRLNKDGYVKFSGTKDGLKNKLLHRIIMGEPVGKEVDHINGNKRDNRRENLRICNRSENNRNTGKKSNNTSGFKGVSWKKQRGKWRASIRVDGKCKHLGYFDDPQTAYRSYCRAATKYHGEFKHF